MYQLITLVLILWQDSLRVLLQRDSAVFAWQQELRFSTPRVASSNFEPRTKDTHVRHVGEVKQDPSLSKLYGEEALHLVILCNIFMLSLATHQIFYMTY